MKKNKITNYFTSPQTLKRLKASDGETNTGKNKETEGMSCYDKQYYDSSEHALSTSNDYSERFPECWDLDNKAMLCDDKDDVVSEHSLPTSADNSNCLPDCWDLEKKTAFL